MAYRLIGFSAATDGSSKITDLLTDFSGRLVQDAAFQPADITVHTLSDIENDLRSARFRSELEGQARGALLDCEAADALVIAASVKAYRGYPGLLKHLIDMADLELLRRKPIVVLAIGPVSSATRHARLELRLLFRSVGATNVRLIGAPHTQFKQLMSEDPGFFRAFNELQTDLAVSASAAKQTQLRPVRVA